MKFSISFIRRFYRQYIEKPEICTVTDFGSKEVSGWFKARLLNSKMYLEYGAGASTYLAAQNNVPFVTVESDKCFLKKLQTKIINDGLHDAENQVFRHADIGLTKRWGHPVIWGSVSQKRENLFRMYSAFPFEKKPDFIFIDGRFRVACALKALRALQDQGGWMIVIDDYQERPHYHVIEEFAVIDEMVGGRMAVITSLKNVEEAALEQAITEHETDPR